MSCDKVSIGEFAQRSRLSVKALRLYDELGVLVPARVDEASDYSRVAPSAALGVAKYTLGKLASAVASA